MKDIEYFTKEKLAGVRLLYSRLEAPPEAKAIYLSLFPYNVCVGFLQDYKKTSKDGLDEIKFWYGSTKFIMVVSPALFGITRGVDKATGMSAWKHLYFDSLTGKCLASDRQEAASKLNQIGMGHLSQNELSSAIHYFDMATKNTEKDNSEKASAYMTNLAQAYFNSKCLRKAISKADLAISLSGNVTNAKAREIKENAQTKLDAYLEHYIKGREIWIAAWQINESNQQSAYIGNIEAERELRVLEAKSEFEKAYQLDDSNEEYQRALLIAQRNKTLNFISSDFELSEASEIFGLAVNFTKIGDLRLAQEKFIEADQIFKTVERLMGSKSGQSKQDRELSERYTELIQEYQTEMQKHLMYIDVKKQIAAENPDKTDVKSLQTIESFEYDRSYFSFLCRLKNIESKKPHSDLIKDDIGFVKV